MMKKFLYPLIDNRFEKEEINAAIKVIKSKQLTISKITEKFEKDLLNLLVQNMQ